MQCNSWSLALLVAAVGVGCSGVGIQTEATLGSQVLQEPELASLWGTDDVLTTKEMSPSDEVTQQSFADAWMGPDGARPSNSGAELDAETPRAERFLERTMYIDEVASQRRDTAMRSGLTNGF